MRPVARSRPSICALPASKTAEYEFACRPLGSVHIAGKVVEAKSLRENGAVIQARYIARWAHSFLGLTDDTVLVIPMGEANLSADGSFQIRVPDLFQDRLAGGSADGELQLWARDKSDQSLIAQLTPKNATRTRGLKIERAYSPEIAFAVCGLNRSPLRDASGFARRSDPDGCQR